MDIMHYHLNGNGKYGKYEGSWDEAVGYYREIMRHPDDINFVTVLREPRSHFLRFESSERVRISSQVSVSTCTTSILAVSSR